MVVVNEIPGVLAISLVLTCVTCSGDVIVRVKPDQDSTTLLNFMFSLDLFEEFYNCLSQGKYQQCSADYRATNTTITNVNVSRQSISHDNFTCSVNTTELELTCDSYQFEQFSENVTLQSLSRQNSTDNTCMFFVWNSSDEGVILNDNSPQFNVEYCEGNCSCSLRHSITVNDKDAVQIAVIISGVIIAILLAVGIVVALTILQKKRKAMKNNVDNSKKYSLRSQTTDTVNAIFNFHPKHLKVKDSKPHLQKNSVCKNKCESERTPPHESAKDIQCPSGEMDMDTPSNRSVLSIISSDFIIRKFETDVDDRQKADSFHTESQSLYTDLSMGRNGHNVTTGDSRTSELYKCSPNNSDLGYTGIDESYKQGIDDSIDSKKGETRQSNTYEDITPNMNLMLNSVDSIDTGTENPYDDIDNPEFAKRLSKTAYSKLGCPETRPRRHHYSIIENNATPGSAEQPLSANKLASSQQNGATDSTYILAKAVSDDYEDLDCPERDVSVVTTATSSPNRSRHTSYSLDDVIDEMHLRMQKIKGEDCSLSEQGRGSAGSAFDEAKHTYFELEEESRSDSGSEAGIKRKRAVYSLIKFWNTTGGKSFSKRKTRKHTPNKINV